MGRIIRPDGVSPFSKMVASVWFRPKSEAIAAATARWNLIRAGMNTENGLFERYYPGLMPFMEWGPPHDIFTRDNDQSRCSPSMFGLHCGRAVAGDGDDDVEAQAYLYARFQYATGGPVDGTQGAGQSGPDYYEIGGHTGGLLTTGVGTYDRIPVSADQWHHGILSCDMTDGSGITFTYPNSVVINSTCKVYLAFDDANYANKYLGPYNNATLGPFWNFTGDTGNPNSIFSSWNLWSGGNFGPFPNQVNPQITRCDAGNMPSDPFSFPSFEPLYSPHIEYGPCAVFFGEVLDTSQEENRRLFINDDGEPTDPSVAIEYFDRVPDIGFAAAIDWITGTNTGTAGPFDMIGTIRGSVSPPKLGN